jgi:hypothetical protein
LEVQLNKLQRETEFAVDNLNKLITEMMNSNAKTDESVHKTFDGYQGRLDRHRTNIDNDHKRIRELERSVSSLLVDNVELKVQVESMADKLCRCGDRSPALSGAGTRNSPFELDYESDASYTAPPVENQVPLPVVLEQSPLPSSNQENIPPACCADPPASSDVVMVPLVESEDERVFRVSPEEAERRKKVLARLNKRVVVRQTCIRSKGKIPDRFIGRMVPGGGRKTFRDYHLGVHHEFRRNGRRIERGLGGYESSSESGSEGLSDQQDSDYHGPPGLPLAACGLSDVWVEGQRDAHW